MNSKTKNTERLEQQAIDLYTEQKFADERLRSVLIGAMIGTVPLYQCERFRAEYLAQTNRLSARRLTILTQLHG